MKKRPHFGTIIGLAIAGYLAFLLIGIVKHNFELRRQVDALQQQITGLKDEEAQLQYDIQYYQTDSFKEKEARAKLGLMQPGENVIVLPKTDQTQHPVSQSTAKPESNWKQWMDFLFGH